MELIALTNGSLGLALNCTDSSGGTAFRLLGNDGDSIVVANVGNSVGYLAIAGLGVTAVAPGTTCSYPILVNTKEDQIIIKIDAAFHADPWVAGVCAAGENTILTVHRVSR